MPESAQDGREPAAVAGAERAALLRWLGLGLPSYATLPLFALLLLGAIWIFTLQSIRTERAQAENAARTSTGELIDTYEAQMARNLDGIDQTLKVLKYAIELEGADGALPALNKQGLLPPSLVFTVSIADRDGVVVASNPPGPRDEMSGEPYFTVHRDAAADTPFVSRVQLGAGGAHMHFSRRINDAAGRFGGVAVLEVDPAYFTSAYEHSRQGAQGLLGMFGPDGEFRALRIGDTLSWGGRAYKPGAGPSPAEPAASPWDGVRRYSAVRELHGFPLSVVVGLAEDEQMAAFAQHQRSYLWSAASASALLILVVTIVCVWSWQLIRGQRGIRRAQETYAAASEASPDGFFVMRSVQDADGGVIDFVIEATNTRAEQMAGQTKEQLHGARLCNLIPAYRHNGVFAQLVKAMTEGGVHEAEWQGGTPAMRGIWMHRQLVGVEGGVVAIIRDITERKLADERIRHMAHHDTLTGLPNRSLIRERIEQAMAGAQVTGGCVAVAFIDLDGFKLVNDGLGHKAGDELLKVVGQRMMHCLRREDTVGRFGGDEFVLILSDAGESAQAVAPVLEKVRQSVVAPFMLGGQEVRIGCSMGVVLYPRDGADPDTLIINADAAMYRAKEMGNNNIQFYTSEMNASGEEKLSLLEGLRNALEQNQLRLVYQPKVDLRSGLVFGVEALIRWHHPEHGVISPLRFIGLAEDSGLIVEIGEWVLQTACRQNRAWQVAGLAPITVSVNVSPRQFAEKRLVGRVAQALRESSLAPHALELEVTESLIMRDLTQSVGKMRELEEMGVRLSIDDFGTGYSSLSALKSFPISSLKIDMSFISELAENADDQAIAMAIISLGHKLNLRVIAEGVETEQQRDFLRANDCDEIQGFLVSPPLPPGQIAQMLEAQAKAQAGVAAH
ncbi:bifunctional diguanylate cyclase/phosphodiesterase [Massilia glaciei]|uniref:GGDEF domain-containing protein n=1 Tax=Massilia glaciei TaxID=1524097 RepID=A0A2U2HM26_9BURK|nr:EAL domain-containing protein [Massilia glaciei]PWF48571.1 GGDEF domain-containing protein [Massilia glaciei]